MKSFKNFIDEETNLPQFITKEMIDFFDSRTNMHIDLVKKNGKKLIKKLEMEPELKELFEIVLKNHDSSKFQEPEKTPYILTSWKYKVGKDEFDKLNVPQEMLSEMTKATEHHVKNNKHHPEYWDKTQNEGIINTVDRDKPAVLIDATKMPKFYLLEMCCDWVAVSEERKTNPFDWADNNINIRWNFDENQVKLIYSILELLYPKNPEK